MASTMHLLDFRNYALLGAVNISQN